MSQTDEQQVQEDQPAEVEPSTTSSPSPEPTDVPRQLTRGPDGRFKPIDGWVPEEEWSGIPAAAQKRFNGVYSALKHQQALGEQLLNDNVILADRLEKLEKRITASESGLEASTEAQLKGAKAAALAAQDYQRVIEIDDAIFELKAKAIQQPKVQQITALSESPATQNYQLDDATKALLDEWGSARGQDGHPLRPWVDPRHPLHEKANRAHQLVMADPMTAFAPIENVLDAIDKYMGVESRTKAVGAPQPSVAAKPAKHAAFLGTENPPKSKGPMPNLTAQQMHIAQRMFRGDPDPIGRYRRAIATHGT